MQTLVRYESWDVNQRLANFDLTVELLQRSQRAGHLALLTCTDNDPPFIPGINSWWRTLRSFREQVCPNGWRKDDPANFSLTINDDRKINVIVTSGDEHTGHPKGRPRNKSQKGLRTLRAVNANATLDLFPETLSEGIRRGAERATYENWIFLSYISPSRIHGELSSPRSIENGWITGWRERILLPHIEIDPAKIEIHSDDFTPPLDIDIQRIA